ncbi:MAG: ribosome maturation factor RimP [Bacillota bacterium]
MSASLEKALIIKLEPIINTSGYELVDVSYLKEAGQWYLRLFIDHPHGITLQDCRYITERIMPVLDKDDPIPHQYLLEVSSPGLERPIKKEQDFPRFYGRKVKIKLHAAFNGQKKYEGILRDNSAEFLCLQIDNELLKLPKSLIAKVNLHPDLLI